MRCPPGCSCGRHYDRCTELGDISVKARHNRVRKLRGKATEHQCQHCQSQARDWATVHGKDGYDPFSDYIPLCRSCHRSYDKIGERQSGKERPKVQGELNGSSKHSCDEVSEIRRLVLEEGITQAEVCRIFDISYTAVQRIVHFRSYRNC